jgi:hypothetical protein
LTVRHLLLIPLALVFLVPALAVADDTPKATATRKKLQDKIDVEWKDTLLRDVIDELNDKVPTLGIRADTKNGVQLNTKVTYKGKEKPVGEILNDLCDKHDMGYYIIANKANGYDGTVYLTRNKEQRGYESGKGPDKTAANPKEKPDKPRPDKPKPEKVAEKPDKPKPEKVADKPEKEKPEKPVVEDDPDELERVASRRLKLAKELVDDGKAEKARDVLADLVKKYPKTKAAEEAQKLLKEDK